MIGFRFRFDRCGSITIIVNNSLPIIILPQGLLLSGSSPPNHIRSCWASLLKPPYTREQRTNSLTNLEVSAIFCPSIFQHWICIELNKIWGYPLMIFVSPKSQTFFQLRHLLIISANLVYKYNECGVEIPKITWVARLEYFLKLRSPRSIATSLSVGFKCQLYFSKTFVALHTHMTSASGVSTTSYFLLTLLSSILAIKMTSCKVIT